MSDCTTIPSNPDVSGIGIRVNLYITMLLVAIIPETKSTSPLLHGLITNAGISGVALLITALIQTSKNSLSLYHAVFIIHILYFTGILVAPSGNYKGSVHSHLRRAIMAVVMTYGSVLLFTGYAFYVWARAPTFGQNHECNSQIKYIFFFKSISVTTGWLRRLWMAGLGISLALLILLPLISCLCICLLGDGSGSGSSSGGGVKRTSTKSSKFLAAVYGVVMLELYEKRNQHLLSAGENQWTFGQIFSIIQIISVFNELLHFLLSGCSADEEEEGEPGDEEPVNAQPQQPDSASIGSRKTRLPTFSMPWKRKEEKKDNSRDNTPTTV